MAFNLIHEPWIPARRRSGEVEMIPPWKITDSGRDGNDPFEALAALRPDFNGSLVQFLIGLVQTTRPPKTRKEWRKNLKEPPPPEDLRADFETVAFAFNLDGEGPRFMQDFEKLEGGQSEIRQLLIDQPGESTLKQNKDFFVKRNLVRAACPACAAQALFTMQTNAPAGGSGIRTSLRGGGPLTTVVLGDALWRTVFLNLVPEDRFLELTPKAKVTEERDRFPWTGPTRNSVGGKKTTPEDVHPLTYFWASPRRIRLEFRDPENGACCDLCGRPADIIVDGYKTQKLGPNYEGPFFHPLTPHY